jgi:opacity protein-like surface antigen
MLKKVLTATILTASSSLVFAGTMGTPCPAYNYLAGPYVGASVGPITNVAGAPANYQGFEGTLSVGWGHLMNRSLYIAGEFFGGSNARLKNSSIAGDPTSVASSYQYGFDIIPGFMITDHVLGYFRAGVVRTQFNDVNVGRTGWQVGIGGQTNVYRNIDIRGEFIYSQYNAITGVGTPRSDQFNLGLVYKFV